MSPALDHAAKALDIVRRAIGEILGMPPEDVKPEQRLRADLDCDEVDLIETVYLIELEADIELADMDLMEIQTVGRLIELTVLALETV
jgi:acyl carrier protein